MKLKTTRADGTEVELELTPEQEKAMEVRKSTKRWRAKCNCMYWFIGRFGDMTDCSEYNDSIDNYRYNIGNYYQTQEQAEFARDKQLAIVKINDRIAELNGELISGVNYYSIYLSVRSLYSISHDSEYKLGTILSSMYSSEVAQQIIEEFRDDLLKYIFN